MFYPAETCISSAGKSVCFLPSGAVIYAGVLFSPPLSVFVPPGFFFFGFGSKMTRADL